MPTRNTGIFCAESEIIKALGGPLKNPPDALDRLENHFKDSLIIAAGAAQNVARHAEPQKFRDLRICAAKNTENVSADLGSERSVSKVPPRAQSKWAPIRFLHLPHLCASFAGLKFHKHVHQTPARFQDQ